MAVGVFLFNAISNWLDVKRMLEVQAFGPFPLTGASDKAERDPSEEENLTNASDDEPGAVTNTLSPS